MFTSFDFCISIVDSIKASFLHSMSGENTELTSRLQTVRQKAAELEKNLANVTATCEKYEDVSLSTLKCISFLFYPSI